MGNLPEDNLRKDPDSKTNLNRSDYSYPAADRPVDPYSYSRVPAPTERGRNNSMLVFLLGVVTTALLGAIGLAAYLFTQRSQPNLTSAATVLTQEASPLSAAEPSPAEPAELPVVSGDLPAPQALSLQVNHPNGSTLRLTRLGFAEDSIVADLAITNGYKEAIKLNNSDDMVITDSLGNQYNLAAPPDNTTITIQPGTTLKGQFVFKGRLAPNANAITLTTNSKFGTSASFSTNPKFALSNISVQGGNP